MIKKGILLTAVTGGLLFLSACGGTPKPPTEPGACTPNDDGPVVAIIVDTSDSTSDEREKGGEYEKDLVKAFDEAAVAESTISTTFADGDPLGSSTWEISDCGFQLSGIAGVELQKRQIQNQAKAFKPELEKVLSTQVTSGSDLLGALKTAERLFADYPDRPRSLVLLTDGGLSKTIRLRGNFPMTEQERTASLKRLESRGLLPDLTGGEGDPVAVWIGGLGLDVGQGDSEKTAAVIEFWKQLIPAANGELRSESSTLRLIDFPAE